MGVKRKNQPGYVKSTDRLGRTIWVKEVSPATGVGEEKGKNGSAKKKNKYKKKYKTYTDNYGRKQYRVPGYSEITVQWSDTHNGENYEYATGMDHPVPSDSGEKNKVTGWFIAQNGQPAGYICYFQDEGLEDDNPNRLVLEAIEVHKDFQGQGFSKFMINSVADNLGEEMYCTGNFTPQGFQALAGYLPVLPGFGDDQIDYEDMDFVKDWDEFKIPSWMR